MIQIYCKAVRWKKSTGLKGLLVSIKFKIFEWTFLLGCAEKVGYTLYFLPYLGALVVSVGGTYYLYGAS